MSKETIRCPDNEDNKYRENNEVQSTMVTTVIVTFEWNALLNLSGEAVTKTFSSLDTELMLQILGQSTRTMTIWMIRGEGVGDIPGVRGVQGVCRFCAT